MRPENEYPKLARDRIPERIKQNEGRDAHVRAMADDEEFLKFLMKKATEEAFELTQADSDQDMAEEMADLYEVMDAILALKGMLREDVVKIQADKRSKRGGFEKRILMLDND